MDVLIRYIPVLRLLSKHETVLEIGSGTYGLCNYVNRKMYAIDPLLYKSNFNPNLIPVGSDLFNNKLGNSQFDTVIAIDFLEHIPKEKRRSAIAEMLRMAGKKVILGFPCGKYAQNYDREWFLDLVSKNKPVPDWLEEHVRFGIPSPPEVFSLLSQMKIKFTYFWNAGITLHYFFTKLHHTRGFRKLQRYFDHFCILFYPLVEFLGNLERRKYRLFIVIYK